EASFGPKWLQFARARRDTKKNSGGERNEISRDYSDELRLWVVGERPWDHCAAGLAGRVRRRLLPEGSLRR
ncbi:MAG: hypothetical protein M3316_00160, partial [Actinomycetota bacterium]|nr:hypothetical protein [Actinomycetota bacterium]